MVTMEVFGGRSLKAAATSVTVNTTLQHVWSASEMGGRNGNKAQSKDCKQDFRHFRSFFSSDGFSPLCQREKREKGKWNIKSDAVYGLAHSKSSQEKKRKWKRKERKRVSLHWFGSVGSTWSWLLHANLILITPPHSINYAESGTYSE